MIKKLSPKGFTLVEVVVVGCLIAIVAAGGYVYWQSNHKQVSSNPTTNSTETKTTTTLIWQKGSPAVPGTYADADIIKISDTTWRLYYAVQPEVQGNNHEVYSATSTDGKTWTQEAGVRKTMATFPEVVQLTDGRYRMYYQSAGIIKSAISNDGLAFTDEAGTRMNIENSDGLTLDNVAAPTILYKDGTYTMVYRGTINQRYAANTPNPTTQLLLWGTSTDGLTVTKKGIAVDTRTSTLNGQLDGPDLVAWDNGEIKLFATSYTGAISFDLKNGAFTNEQIAFAGEAKQDQMGFHGAPPGDPTVAKIGDTWYMYYGGTGAESGIHYATLK